MKDYKVIYFTDDDHDELSLMQEISQSLGHKSFAFKSGNEMLDFLFEQPDSPHIIFLDITMPETDGYEILKKVRSLEKFKEIPIIIHSANWDDTCITKCYELGANYYMRKAFTLNGLRTSLEHSINKDWAGFKAGREEFLYQY